VDADPDKDGDPLEAGVELNDNQDDKTTYAEDGTLCGPVPYLAQYALAHGATGVRIMREATPGANIATLLDQLGLVISTLAAKGWTPDYWVYWQGEEETTNPAQSPAADYEERLDRYARRVFDAFPNCRFVVISLLMRTNNYGGVNNSTNWPTIVAAQEAVASAWPGRVLLVDTQLPTVLPIVSTVHASPGIGGGHDQCMERVSLLW
jgi:hypothetical protein